MTTREVVTCDACGREGARNKPATDKIIVEPWDWSTLHIPWKAGGPFDICRGCVATLMGWVAVVAR